MDFQPHASVNKIDTGKLLRVPVIDSRGRHTSRWINPNKKKGEEISQESIKRQVNKLFAGFSRKPNPSKFNTIIKQETGKPVKKVEGKFVYSHAQTSALLRFLKKQFKKTDKVKPDKIKEDVKNDKKKEEVKKKGMHTYILNRPLLSFDAQTGKVLIVDKSKFKDPYSNRTEKYRRFTKDQKKLAYKSQGGKCKSCKKSMSVEGMEADHIKPWAKGGGTTVQNCQVLCRHCNRTKGEGNKKLKSTTYIAKEVQVLLKSNHKRFIPLRNKILIKPMGDQQISPMVVPANNDKKTYQMGEVLSVGTSDKENPIKVKEGDIILYYSLKDMPSMVDNDYLLLSNYDVECIVNI